METLFSTLFWPRGIKEKNPETLLHIYKTHPMISQSIICLLFEM